jgi:hypothetical protein
MVSLSFEHLRVMTRGDSVKSQSLGSLEKQIEFDVAIALNARIRRRRARVPFDKWRHDTTFEFFGVIKNVVIYAEYLSNATCVVNVGHRTTAGV